ncbi:hypothetical protein D9615_004301 [Tricholomella constricta]|uniref:Uncharacterized protein n=1 Tax=Tricholomella constricta TaxID=117010 RepID=A0A8H5HFE1_9AGAR|nr:hypothetical protein D9615_004301 [Tricholomella constricta]
MTPASSLFHLFFERITPTPLRRLLTHGHDEGPQAMPPELLDQIIDRSRNDRPTLLALGLVSKQTLARSRHYLFSTVEFDDNDKHFDTFLGLLDAPWTSFTAATVSLHVKDLFHSTRGYTYRPKRNILRILSSLTHLTTLWVTSTSWRCIPSHIRQFFFQLRITDLQFDSVEFYESEFVEFFSMLQPSTAMITAYNLKHEDGDDLSAISSIFQQQFRLKTLDSYSLVLLKDVWDPLRFKDLNVTVESFHLRLLDLATSDRETSTAFISRFLTHIGPSLKRLFINISEPHFWPDVLPFYECVDFSQCVNLRVIHFGTVTLDHGDAAEKMSSMVSTMWKLLSALPSHSIEEVVLTFDPHCSSVEGSLDELKRFPWLDLVTRVQKMFQVLQKIEIRMGGSYFRYGRELAPHVEALRQAGLRQLEEEGVVSFSAIPRAPGETLQFESPWREVTDSL